MWTVTIQKTVVDPDGSEIVYTYSANANNEADALQAACIYGSMVEYGTQAEKWAPKDMAFPEEQLLQFIQRSTLHNLKQMYPDVVPVAYMNAMAYVQSYIGAMYDIDAMLVSGDTSSTALTLRLALCICTVTYILASAPQYSDVIEMHNRQLHTLLKGLKSGQRNFGKAAIAGEPDVRVSVVNLAKPGNRP